MAIILPTVTSTTSTSSTGAAVLDPILLKERKMSVLSLADNDIRRDVTDVQQLLPPSETPLDDFLGLQEPSQSSGVVFGATKELRSCTSRRSFILT